MRALTDLVERHTAAQDRTGTYRPPDARAVAALPVLLDDVVAGRDPAAGAAALGLQATRTAGRTVLHPPDPGGAPWLLIAVPPSAPTVLVEVPHPRADLDTDLVALALIARLPSALLLMAGAHRIAAGPTDPALREVRAAYPADVAVRTDALFSLSADGLVVRTGCPQVQVHGFADRAPRDGVDVVVSAGAAPRGLLVTRVHRALTAAGLRVRGPADPGCADLAGRRNVQGLAARRLAAPFLHLELSRAVRADPAARETVAGVVAGVLQAMAPRLH